MNILIINRYSCPVNKNTFIMGHEFNLETLEIEQSYPKADETYINFLTDKYDNVILYNVAKSSQLAEVNVIKKGEVK